MLGGGRPVLCYYDMIEAGISIVGQMTRDNHTESRTLYVHDQPFERYRYRGPESIMIRDDHFLGATTRHPTKFDNLILPCELN